MPTGLNHDTPARLGPCCESAPNELLPEALGCLAGALAGPAGALWPPEPCPPAPRLQARTAGAAHGACWVAASGLRGLSELRRGTPLREGAVLGHHGGQQQAPGSPGKGRIQLPGMGHPRRGLPLSLTPWGPHCLLPVRAVRALPTPLGHRVGVMAPSTPGEFCAGKTQGLGPSELVAASENTTAGELPALRPGRDPLVLHHPLLSSSFPLPSVFPSFFPLVHWGPFLSLLWAFPQRPR